MTYITFNVAKENYNGTKKPIIDEQNKMNYRFTLKLFTIIQPKIFTYKVSSV